MIKISYFFIKKINYILVLSLSLTIVSGFVSIRHLSNEEQKIKHKINNEIYYNVLQHTLELNVLKNMTVENYQLQIDQRLEILEDKIMYFKIRYPFGEKTSKYLGFIRNYKIIVESEIENYIECLRMLLNCELIGEKIALKCGQSTGLKGKGMVGKYLEDKINDLEKEKYKLKAFYSD